LLIRAKNKLQIVAQAFRRLYYSTHMHTYGGSLQGWRVQGQYQTGDKENQVKSFLLGKGERIHNSELLENSEGKY
jgi:hypothetical protein